MTAEPRRIRRRGAARPDPRTITVTIPDGRFAGWSATARADFPAKVVMKLESGRIADILEAIELIVLEHNMPDENGDVAETIADVDPYAGLLAVSAAIGEALGKLPNR